MPWIESIGDLAAETGLPLHVGTTNRAPGKCWLEQNEEEGS